MEIANLLPNDRLPNVPEGVIENPEFGTVVNITPKSPNLVEWESEIQKHEIQKDLKVHLTEGQKLRILRIATDSNQSPQDVIDKLLDNALEGAIGKPMISKPSWAKNNVVTGYSANSPISRVDSTNE